MRLNSTATRLHLKQIRRLLMLSLHGGVVMLMSNTLAAHAQGSLAVRAWSSDSTGQIGDGNDKAQYLPVPSHTLADVRAVSAGWQHNLALRADGAVWAWDS